MKPVSIVVREDAMVPLDRWLATELAQALGRNVPRGLTRKAILKGLAAVGGRIVRDPGLMLRRGPSVFVRNLDWIPAADPAATLAVLFEDEWLIAVDKPAERLMLHAERLAIDHPITGKQLVITSPRPEAFTVSESAIDRATQPGRLGADPRPARAALATRPAAGPRLAKPSHTGKKPRKPRPASIRGSRR